MFDVRTFTGDSLEAKIHNLQQIRNPNFLQIYEVFDDNGVFYTVSEHMQISLAEAILVPKDFSEVLLGSVIHYVCLSAPVEE